jgi:hypothetical protein
MVGGRCNCISEQKGQNAESRNKKTSRDHGGRPTVGDRHGCISKQEGQNAEFRKQSS